VSLDSAQSNIALQIDHGATIIAADQPAAGQPGYDSFEPNLWGDRLQFRPTGSATT
jgi:hypothetical protein